MASIHDDPELIVKALAGDVEARNKIIMLMLGFLHGIAIPIAVRYKKDHDELVQVAIVKIIKKFHRFRPDLSSPMTYFGSIAYREMLEYANRDNVVIPAQDCMDNPATRPYGDKTNNIASLDACGSDFSGDFNGFDFQDSKSILADYREQTPEELASTEEINNLVHESMDRLPPRQKVVIEYILKGKNLSDIGKLIGRSREMVRQMAIRAKEQMKLYIESKLNPKEKRQ